MAGAWFKLHFDDSKEKWTLRESKCLRLQWEEVLRLERLDLESLRRLLFEFSNSYTWFGHHWYASWSGCLVVKAF